ncbi:hypothetical protein LINGRAHAP2_LOCUS25804, partial [Linum grandiflorum]
MVYITRKIKPVPLVLLLSVIFETRVLDASSTLKLSQ